MPSYYVLDQDSGNNDIVIASNYQKAVEQFRKAYNYGDKGEVRNYTVIPCPKIYVVAWAVE